MFGLRISQLRCNIHRHSDFSMASFISGVKIAIGHQIFPTDRIFPTHLIKLLSYLDKFSKMCDSKKKEDKKNPYNI